MNKEILKFLYPLLPENINLLKEDLAELIFRDRIDEYLKQYFSYIDDSESYDSVYQGIKQFLVWVINKDYLDKSEFIIEKLDLIALVYNMNVDSLIEELLPIFQDNAWILNNLSSRTMNKYECFVHCAPIEYRDNILENGLQPQHQNDGWLLDTPLSPKQKWLFLTITDFDMIENDVFDTGLDNDIWVINIKELPDDIKERIYYDPNMYKYHEQTQHCVTPLNIPSKYIKLYYEGSE